jgi:hypothetical protein
MEQKGTSNQICRQRPGSSRRVGLGAMAVAKTRAAAALTVTSGIETQVIARSEATKQSPTPRTPEIATARVAGLAMTERTHHRVIPLTRGKFAIVDPQDYERLAEYKWYAAKITGNFYAQRGAKGTTIKMHREIVDIPPGLVCDHRNHDTLDNRKSNLRICTQAQNSYNQLPRDGGTSRYKGVCWHRDHCRWEASIKHKGRTIHIGYYDYEADAAIAYDDMAVELFGEFACLNFHYRPEIRLWMEATYLFEPTKNELSAVACHSCESRSPEPSRGTGLPPFDKLRAGFALK